MVKRNNFLKTWTVQAYLLVKVLWIPNIGIEGTSLYHDCVADNGRREGGRPSPQRLAVIDYENSWRELSRSPRKRVPHVIIDLISVVRRREQCSVQITMYSYEFIHILRQDSYNWKKLKKSYLRLLSSYKTLYFQNKVVVCFLYLFPEFSVTDIPIITIASQTDQPLLL